MLKNWLLAIRPKTLPAAIAPVVIGTSMAMGDGVGDWPAAAAALFGALMIQIATNLINDYYDFKKGADTPDRLGPIRVTQAGLIKPQAVLTAAVIAFVLTGIACAYLVHKAGWVILVIGIASIISGVLYTAGKKPIGYMGLGDLFVFIFFGPVAVAGTYFAQAQEMNMAVIAAGMGTGFLSTAILAVNNLRDIEGDRKAGKMTLAVRFGEPFAKSEYLFCIMGATVTPFIVYLISHDHWAASLSAVTGFWAIPTIGMVFTLKGKALNDVLAKTGLLLLNYSILFSAGWLLCSR